MIEATRLNGETVWINPEVIEIVETTPDTMIKMTNGRKFMVKESPDQIKQRFLVYQRFVRMPLDAKIVENIKHTHSQTDTKNEQ